jgi:hypothetical protein
MNTPRMPRPPCPGCGQVYQAKRHCDCQGCTWRTCTCGTTYSVLHPEDHYRNA